MVKRIRKSFRKPGGQSGYTMIVMAALFTAFMVTVGAVVQGNVVGEQVGRQKNVNAQIHALSAAIIQYAIFNKGRYPCPAPYNVAYTDPTFGISAAGCESGTPSGIDILTGSSNEVIRGMVPVRTLAAYGLNIDDAFDSWNSRIMYVVDRNLTTNGSGTATNRPHISDRTLVSASFTRPDFILISYGKDHLGGIMKSQTSSFTATGTCPATKTRPAEENCDMDSNFYRGALNTNTNASSAAYFDDIVTSFAGGRDCPAIKVNWLTNCSYTMPTAVPDGSTIVVPNTAAGYIGGVVASCKGGYYILSDPGCAPTGGGCTWTDFEDTWTNSSTCANIPGWSTLNDCGATAPCNTINTQGGSVMTFATASTNCTNAQCRNGTTCSLNYAGITNSASAPMRYCRVPANGACTAQLVTWGSNCSAVVPSLANGAPTTVNNTSAGYTGTASFTCSGGVVTPGASSCTPSPCSGGTAFWGTACSGTYGALTSGGSTSVTNTVTGYTGSETATCAFGVVTYTSPTCTANPCTAGSTTWGTACGGSYGVINSGNTASVTNTTSGWSGSETASCTNGVISFSSPTCTANGCSGGTASWLTNCSGPYTAMASGGSQGVTNSNAGYTGAETASCTAGTVSFSGASCTQITCPSGSTTWLTNCSGPYSTINAGASQTVNNTAANFTGAVTENCSMTGVASFSGASCTGNSCTLPWGGSIASGSSVTAYLSAAPNGACSSETRTCTNGTLSGSYTVQTCNPGCAAISPAKWTNASYNGTGPCAANLPAEPYGWSGSITNTTAGYTGSVSFACQAGATWNPNSGGSTCVGNSCTLPWGGSIASGNSVTAYSTSTPTGSTGCTSAAQTRTCTAGTLSGSYTNQTCTNGCDAYAATWTQGSAFGGPCTYSLPAAYYLQLFSVSNQTGNYTGNLNATCGSNTVTQWNPNSSGATCAAITPCPASSYHWGNFNGATGCYASFSGQASGWSGTISNQTGVNAGSDGFTGSFHASCSNGTWSYSSASCSATTAFVWEQAAQGNGSAWSVPVCAAGSVTPGAACSPQGYMCDIFGGTEWYLYRCWTCSFCGW